MLNIVDLAENLPPRNSTKFYDDDDNDDNDDNDNNDDNKANEDNKDNDDNVMMTTKEGKRGNGSTIEYKGLGPMQFKQFARKSITMHTLTPDLIDSTITYIYDKIAIFLSMSQLNQYPRPLLHHPHLV